MVEIELPDLGPEGYPLHLHATIYLFYISAAIALSLALYVVAISTFAVMAGYRLALLGGQTQSLDRAVAVLLIEFRSVVTAAAVGIVAIIFAAGAIAWVKMQEAGLLVPLSIIYVVNAIGIACGLSRVRERLRIDKGTIVHGDANIISRRGERVNLAEIEMPRSDDLAHQNAEDMVKQTVR